MSGAAVVVNNAGKAYGIITRTDIIEHIAKKKEAALLSSAAEVMKNGVIAVEPGIQAELAYAVMDANMISRVPVIKNGVIEGIVTHRGITNLWKESYDILKSDHNELKQKMSYDYLTGLYNKEYMELELKKWFELCLKDKINLALILADIDNFKGINDTYGHDCGDHILASVALFIKNGIRSMDVPGRFGGDEFMIICPLCDGNTARRTADMIRKNIEKWDVKYGPAPVAVGISCGIASLTPGTFEYKDLLKLADNCLYEAKRKGKNRVCYTAGLGFVLKNKP